MWWWCWCSISADSQRSRARTRREIQNESRSALLHAMKHQWSRRSCLKSASECRGWPNTSWPLLSVSWRRGRHRLRPHLARPAVSRPAVPPPQVSVRMGSMRKGSMRKGSMRQGSMRHDCLRLNNALCAEHPAGIPPCVCFDLLRHVLHPARDELQGRRRDGFFDQKVFMPSARFCCLKVVIE